MSEGGVEPDVAVRSSATAEDLPEASFAAAGDSDVQALTEAGREIRGWVEEAALPAPLEQAIREAYAAMSEGGVEPDVAVRSSATAEDLPEASFA
ncbi:hypothetical protein CTI14_60395, partial [Methylobacterium radiotolerans]